MCKHRRWKAAWAGAGAWSVCLNVEFYRMLLDEPGLITHYLKGTYLAQSNMKLLWIFWACYMFDRKTTQRSGFIQGLCPNIQMPYTILEKKDIFLPKILNMYNLKSEDWTVLNALIRIILADLHLLFSYFFKAFLSCCMQNMNYLICHFVKSDMGRSSFVRSDCS